MNAHPLYLYLLSRTNLQRTLQLSGQICTVHSPYLISVDICTLWSDLPRGENAGGYRDPDQVVHGGEQEVHPDPGDRLLGQLQARHHVQQVVPDQHQAVPDAFFKRNLTIKQQVVPDQHQAVPDAFFKRNLTIKQQVVPDQHQPVPDAFLKETSVDYPGFLSRASRS